MKITHVISMLLLTLMFNCAPDLAKVHVDYDKEANFSQYRTFSWSEEIEENNKDNNPLLNNSLVKKRIRAAIKSELEGRGYVFTPEKGDLEVNFHVVVEEKTEVRNVPSQGYRYWMRDDVRSYNYKEGTLIIDLIDQEQNQLVWQGYSSGVLKDKPNPEEVENKLRESISLIFQEYKHRAG